MFLMLNSLVLLVMSIMSVLSGFVSYGSFVTLILSIPLIPSIFLVRQFRTEKFFQSCFYLKIILALYLAIFSISRMKSNKFVGFEFPIL